MKIRMIADTRVAKDGSTVETWAKGEVYETDDQLGGDLIGAGRAEPVREARPGRDPAQSGPLPAAASRID